VSFDPGQSAESRAAHADAAFELHFRQPEFLPRSLTWTFAIVIALVASLGSDPWVALAELVYEYSGRHLPPRLLPLLALVLVGLPTLLWRTFGRPRRVHPIIVGRDKLVVPRSAGSSRTYSFGYGELTSFELIGGALIVGTRWHVLAYPLDDMLEPDAVEPLVRALQARVSERPDAPALLETLARRRALGKRLRARPFPVTRALLGMLAAVYALELVRGAPDSELELLRFGANAPDLTLSGQFFRLVTSTFLHGIAPHFVLNAIGLFAMGLVVERALGSFRFLLVYLSAGLAGALASALRGAGLSVGASGAIFGLLGALAVLQWRLGPELPAGFRQSRNWWLFIIGSNSALPLIFPQIDVSAHIGGFVAGALVGVLLVPDAQSIWSAERSKLVKLAAGALSLVFAVGVVQAVVHSKQPPEIDRDRAWQAVILHGSDAVRLNEITWRIAEDPQAKPEALDLARRAGERALELQPQTHEIMDSLATVYYRLGNLDHAIALERRALGTSRRAFYVSQVARFLRARVERSGPLVLGPASGEVQLAPLMSGGGNSFGLRIDGAFPQGAVLWLLVKSGERLEGSAIVELGASDANTRELNVTEPAPSEAERLVYQVALVDSDACGTCAAGSTTWHYQDMDKDVLTLP
jgi:rhomboid protease GluP